jgi:hypothetical protein
MEPPINGPRQQKRNETEIHRIARVTVNAARDESRRSPISMGLIVVYAWPKARNPALANKMPTTTSTPASASRKVLSIIIAGVSRAIAHIITAVSKATSGGGILFSSAFMIPGFIKLRYWRARMNVFWPLTDSQARDDAVMI